MYIIDSLFCNVSLSVNASEAGPGNLEVSITSRGESVRNVARKVDTTGLIEVSYTPIYLDPHIINVRFNCEPVNGKSCLLFHNMQQWAVYSFYARPVVFCRAYYAHLE